MGSNYSYVVERLLMYRNKIGKTQMQMSQMFGVTQGHYAKLESGTKIISYQSLKCFEEHNGDVNFLLTGSAVRKGKIDEIMSACKTAEGRKWLFEALVWIFDKGLRFRMQNQTELSQRTYKCLRLLETMNQHNTIWECIRKNENLSQIRMAEIFDIDVKRYRRIEKLLVVPDAEILNTLYCELQYSPFVIIDQKMYFLDELNQAWDTFSDTVREQIDPLLQEVLAFLQIYESSCQTQLPPRL